LFQVTNHGVPPGTVESALSAVRAFNEQPLASRSAYYSVSTAGPAIYTTVPIPARNAGQPANAPLLPWRDTIVLRFGHGESHLDHLPAACLDALLEYHRSLTVLGKMIAGLLSEALGVGTEQLDRAVQVEATLMQCHYYPPCPQPERVVGSRVHTDGDLFTVVAQDGVGGLQVRLDGHGDTWVDVVPVTGALIVNIGDVLKVLSSWNSKFCFLPTRSLQLSSTTCTLISLRLYTLH
jgi:isopenicillin N synthase-like dioxygenase